jgi:hypothetical protein
MASGEMRFPAFAEFLMTSLTKLAHFSVDGSVHFAAMDWRHMPELLDAGLKERSTAMKIAEIDLILRVHGIETQPTRFQRKFTTRF